jgi:DNA repair protein RadC
MKTWTHPGGKLRELGAESLTDAELLSILISTGTKGKPAEKLHRKSLINLALSREWQTNH